MFSVSTSDACDTNSLYLVPRVLVSDDAYFHFAKWFYKVENRLHNVYWLRSGSEESSVILGLIDYLSSEIFHHVPIHIHMKICEYQKCAECQLKPNTFQYIMMRYLFSYRKQYKHVGQNNSCSYKHVWEFIIYLKKRTVINNLDEYTKVISFVTGNFLYKPCSFEM